ncbi:microtubule-associated protein 10 [Brachyistius frenatus]|uniref:microtubule-associated protein 10 n=1 Tax=Brachyistius frenatus TaxID=100188 RepID=UPI0037E8D91D
MSGQQNYDNPETLFSFELLVEYVRVEEHCKVSDELALGLRLLDFPTLLIYQPRRGGGSTNRPGRREEDERGVHAFNRGKSCFFKMNLNALHIQLANTPLYTMVLDVKEETPKLVGSSLISLAKAVDRIRRDMADRGVCSPSSHRERGLIGICNLAGENIGSISLSYKLLCLGASLLPHIEERRGLKNVPGGKRVQECVEEKHKSTESLPLDSGNVCSPPQDKSDFSRDVQNNAVANAKVLLDENNRDDDDDVCEEDLTLFCPPHLYYDKSAEDKTEDYKFFNLVLEAFPFEDSSSEDEAVGKEVAGRGSPAMHQKVRHGAQKSSAQETSEVTPNVLGEAVRQLPLLNALLVELSQLNVQNSRQPLTVHPGLTWIYGPASTAPSAGHESTPQKAETKSLHKTQPGTGPRLRHFRPPRNCSTPMGRPASVRAKDKQEGGLSKSPRKKLVYGTTKTFNLRLKQVSPLRVKHRECMQVTQNETKSSMAKGKASNKNMKSSRRTSVLNQSSTFSKNVETATQSVPVKSGLKGTITLKHKCEEVHREQDGDTERISEKPSLSERDLKFIHSPSVDTDSVPQSKDKKERHSESDQSQSDSDGYKEKSESSRSSRRSSPKFSDSSGEGNEDADYADDFTSLEPSDTTYSPDPVSSPEPPRVETSKAPLRVGFCNSDSGSEGVRRRAAVLPVPVKAPGSPQRSLRGTRIIPPQTRTSAVSFSSDDGDGGASASLQTIRSGKLKSSRVERSSGAESFISSRGRRSDSATHSSPVRGFSAESVSSFEPREEGELRSLDFRKEYQHISQLVANKLPGYTT